MKKVFNHSVIALFTMMVLSISFIACSDDDNKDENTSSLVGSWKYTFSSGYIIMTFNSDGTGNQTEIDHGYEEDNEDFHYTYQDETLFIKYDEDGYTERIRVYSISEETLVMEDVWDSEDYVILERV